MEVLILDHVEATTVAARRELGVWERRVEEGGTDGVSPLVDPLSLSYT